MTATASPAAPGTLYLIPTPLCQDQANAPDWLAPPDRARLAALRHFAVETPKVARGWLGRLLPEVPVRALDIRQLPAADEAAPDWATWLAPLQAGTSMGLLSDAGCPGIADPGAALVAAAHAAGIPVQPLAGPSAILLLLMASGLQGQRFAFHGYLPVAADAREQAIRDLGRQARERDETQIMIETPYRNQALADSLIATLPPEAVLVIGQGLGSAGESIVRRRVSDWRRSPPILPRIPATFLFGLDAGARPGPVRPTSATAAAAGQAPRSATSAPADRHRDGTSSRRRRR